jgi:membrane-associated PAP2 superfamily phosphatase
MKLNLLKQTTFWGAIAIASVGVVIYVLYFIERGNVPYLQSLAFFLVLVSFVLFLLRLKMK